MTVSMLTGLVMQGGAVWLMHIGVRGQWLRHIGALFLATAVAYHGLTEVMQALWPDQNNSYRRFISTDALDNWMLLVSACLLAYTIAYVAVIRRQRENETAADPRNYLAHFNPWWLLAAAAPFLALTVSGSTATSYRAPGTAQSGSDYVVGGLAGLYLIPLTALAAASITSRYGTRWLLPVLTGQGVLLALGGQRRSIVFAILITLYALAMCGIKLPRKTIAVGMIAGAMLVVTLSASRAVVGREQYGAGVGTEGRATGLLEGSDALSSESGWDGVRNDTVYRLDGNSFGAIAYTGLATGVHSIGLTTVWDTLKLAIPQFLWPGKLSLPLERRNEETYIMLRFTSVQVDYIPGVLGSLVTFFGRTALPILAILIAVAVAAADRHIQHRPGPLRLVLGATLVVGALLYEQGPSGMILSIRGALALTCVFWLAMRARGWFHLRDRQATAQPGSQI